MGEGKEKILGVINSLLQESEQYTYASLPKGEYGYPTHVPASFIVWAKRVDNIIKQYTESSSAPYVLVETYSGQIYNIEGNGQDRFNPIKEALVTALQEAKKILENDFFGELKNNSSDINQVRSPLLESIYKAYAAFEKTAESPLDIDNLSEAEMGFADSVVIDYLTERFGEQDDALGNWPRDWHECHEAFELWEKTIQELRVSEAMESLDQLKGVAETEQETRNSGDTYNITNSQVSLGEKAQHAGRDITTQEPNKKKGGWELVKKIGLILSIIVSLILIVGAYNKYIRKDKPAIERIKTQNLSGNSVDVNNVVFDTRPTADAIIEEIERLPVFEQKEAAENYIGRTFKWRLRFEVLVHEEGGMVYVACKTSPVRGKVSFNINADAKENLKIKKIKKGKFLDVSGEITGISLAREREPRISLKDVRLEFVD